MVMLSRDLIACLRRESACEYDYIGDDGDVKNVEDDDGDEKDDGDDEDREILLPALSLSETRKCT